MTHTISTQFIFSVAICLFLGFNREAISFYCTQSFCADHTSEFKYPCPPAPNCTTTGFRTFLDPDTCNCCEYCFDYLEENDACKKMSPQKPQEMCGPRLTCLDSGSGPDDPVTCQKMGSLREDQDSGKCMGRRYQYETARESGTEGIAQVYPDCDAGGDYAPRQCLPGSICYCSNSVGERIFGISLPNEYQDCACARDVHRIQSFGFTGRLPHCLPNGDYDELQCVVRTCFCRSHPAEVFAMHALNESKCYNPELHYFEPETPRYYMRDCELRRARIEVQIAEAELNGTKMIVADMPLCGPDGNYAPIQYDFENLICVAPNGTPLEDYSYYAPKFSKAATQMNCHCALARFILSETATGKPICCKNGNYRPWQCIGSTCFCVDPLGRQVLPVKEVHEDDIAQLTECYVEPEQGAEASCPDEDY